MIEKLNIFSCSHQCAVLFGKIIAGQHSLFREARAIFALCIELEQVLSGIIPVLSFGKFYE